MFCLWRQEPFHPTMPQADLPEMWEEETPHQGMTSKVEFVGAMVEYDSENTRSSDEMLFVCSVSCLSQPSVCFSLQC